MSMSCGRRCCGKAASVLANSSRRGTAPAAIRPFHALSLDLRGNSSRSIRVQQQQQHRTIVGSVQHHRGRPNPLLVLATTNGMVRTNGFTVTAPPRKTRKRPLPVHNRGLATISTDDETNNDNDSTDGNNFRPPHWLKKMQKRAASNKPMDCQRAYRYLGLETFETDELRDRFRAILESGDGNSSTTMVFDRDHLRSYLSETIRREEGNHDDNNNTIGAPGHDDATIDRLRAEYIEAETRQLWRFLEATTSNNNHNNATPTTITESQFVETLTESATSIDKKRLAPLALSMVMIGLSVGVITPAFPFVVQNLGLTTGEYGMIVSAFALTKLMGNIPFAVLVERHGRKPYLVYSLIAISTGVGCIGLASGFEELYACRLITGLGVAGITCASTMAVSDISTPLNRASSFAPISSGFAAGTAMGPALGGIFIDQFGINPTFYLVGGSFMMLGGINSILLDETMKKPHKGFPWQTERRSSNNTEPNDTDGNVNTANDSSNTTDNESNKDASIQQAFKLALGQWVPLLRKAPVRNVCIVNGFYWVALSGGQMTLLPLLLTDPTGLAMTATQVGQVYMGMSFVQVLGNPLFGKVVDKVGTVPGIVGGCSMISAAMYALPACADGNSLPLMASVLGLWAAGSSLLSTAPIAHIGNTVDDSQRAQAIALLRTAGDVGFLVGASSMGMVSDWAGGLEAAMQSSAAILGTATSWYVARNLLPSRVGTK